MISIFAIPVMMTTILIHGLIKGVKLYDAFTEGAQEGFKTAVRIMPYLIAIFLAVNILRKSGGMDYIIRVFLPITRPLGIPSEILPLAFIRPFSGSGSLAVLKDIITTYGPDSLIGRVASTMMGSAETIFYTMAIYFGAVGIQKSRHTVAAALISHIAAILASVMICRLLFR